LAPTFHENRHPISYFQAAEVLTDDRRARDCPSTKLKEDVSDLQPDRGPGRTGRDGSNPRAYMAFLKTDAERRGGHRTLLGHCGRREQ
jgi:hypothetical protein